MKIFLLFLAACVYSYVGIIFYATWLKTRHSDCPFSLKDEVWFLNLAHALVAGAHYV